MDGGWKHLVTVFFAGSNGSVSPLGIQDVLCAILIEFDHWLTIASIPMMDELSWIKNREKKWKPLLPLMTKFTLPIQYDQFIVLSSTTSSLHLHICPKMPIEKCRQIFLFSSYIIASPRVLLLLWYGSLKKMPLN